MKVVKIMNKRFLINLLITLIFGLVIYYFMLPPINITSPLFWTFIVILLMFYFFLSCFSIFDKNIFLGKNKHLDLKISKSIYLVLIIGVLIFLVNIICSPMFNAKSYASRIKVVEQEDFASNVEVVDFNKVPLLDKESSQKLGDRTMGAMTDLVSQFYVSNLYTQINYNDEILRVTPLEYASIIKYLTNRDEGVKGYITVNSVTGESKLVRLDEGMKYMPSGMFFENLHRKLRLDYPTKIFGDMNFEIDNEGNPYWIVETCTYTGVGLKKEITGVIVLDPITGSSTWYKVGEVPTWIDHVYDADLIIEQFDDYGEYKNGYFNSLFGQKGVVNTTEGYNYLAMNDDI